MVSHQDIVLLFTRYPIPGISKTRLIPILGDRGAAELQKRMTEQVVTEVLSHAARHPCRLEIHYSGGDTAAMRAWLGETFVYKRQADGHIGVKMSQAITAHLGHEHGIILVGSDLPDITRQILAEALHAVRLHDMVIGPACDGGYYLIGVNGAIGADIVSCLFTDIPWGSQTVFAETLARAGRHRLTCHILPELHDIDRPEDLGYINHHPDAQ